MSDEIRTIGVLTSGGDAPGMNAAIRAVVRTSLAYGRKVKGIRKGYSGLLKNDIIDLDSRSVTDIIGVGGTFLYTSRSAKFRTPEGQKQAAQICRDNGIDGIVIIGGDGSFRGAKALSKYGINVVGVPGTIDLDIAWAATRVISRSGAALPTVRKRSFCRSTIIMMRSAL